MGAPDDGPLSGAQATVAVLGAALWAVVLNVLGKYTWGYGPRTFVGLILLAALTSWGPVLAARLEPARARLPSPRTWSAFLAIACLALAVVHAAAFVQRVRDPALKDRLVDVGLNTLCAAQALFTEHRNPYAARCQTEHDVAGSPHVEQGPGGETSLYGVRYAYGYPYFPAMFASFEPFRRAVAGPNAVRWGNAALLVLATVGAAWLARRLVPGERGRFGALLAAVLLLSNLEWGGELFHLGVTDLLIGVWALLGAIALVGRRDALAGVLLGLAFACKLLPGGIFGAVLLVFALRSGRWRPLVAFAVTAVATLGPFILLDPPAFLSATVLFYLTYHAEGDDTALWFFLPRVLQLPFQLAGAVALLVLWLAPLRRRFAFTEAHAITAMFALYAVFIAFNKMSHLNYLWGVLPLGCATYAAALVRRRETATSTASQPSIDTTAPTVNEPGR